MKVVDEYLSKFLLPNGEEGLAQVHQLKMHMTRLLLTSNLELSKSYSDMPEEKRKIEDEMKSKYPELFSTANEEVLYKRIKFLHVCMNRKHQNRRYETRKREDRRKRGHYKKRLAPVQVSATVKDKENTESCALPDNTTQRPLSPACVPYESRRVPLSAAPMDHSNGIIHSESSSSGILRPKERSISMDKFPEALLSLTGKRNYGSITIRKRLGIFTPFSLLYSPSSLSVCAKVDGPAQAPQVSTSCFGILAPGSLTFNCSEQTDYPGAITGGEASETRRIESKVEPSSIVSPACSQLSAVVSYSEAPSTSFARTNATEVEEVRHFLSTCNPPMTRFLSRFLAAGCRDRQFLKAVSKFTEGLLKEFIDSLPNDNDRDMNNAEKIVLKAWFAEYFQRLETRESRDSV